MSLEIICSMIAYVYENYGLLLTGLHTIVMFFIGMFLVIPGKQPEQALRAMANWLERYSKK